SDARKVSVRSDVYSLGCTLYYLLSAAPPFSGLAYETPASKIKGHLVDLPPSPQNGRRKLPSVVLDVLERMMAKPPEDRPDSLAVVVETLTPYCAGARLGELVIGELPPLSPMPKPRRTSVLLRDMCGLPLRAVRFFGRRRRTTVR